MMVLYLWFVLKLIQFYSAQMRKVPIFFENHLATCYVFRLGTLYSAVY